jgi:hypothetical protein
MIADQSAPGLPQDVVAPPRTDRAMLALQYLIAGAAAGAALLLASVR